MLSPGCWLPAGWRMSHLPTPDWGRKLQPWVIHRVQPSSSAIMSPLILCSRPFTSSHSSISSSLPCPLHPSSASLPLFLSRISILPPLLACVLFRPQLSVYLLFLPSASRWYASVFILPLFVLSILPFIASLVTPLWHLEQQILQLIIFYFYMQ